MENKRDLFKFGLLLIGCFSCMLSFGQMEGEYALSFPYPPIGEPRQSVVIAFSGLRLRSAPSFAAKVTTTIPFGETVYRPKSVLNGNDSYEGCVWTKDSIAGFWEKVVWKNKTGYAFNAFLAQELRKMTDDYYLMEEDRGICWSDAYADTSYHYYGMFLARDSSYCTLREFRPTFYAQFHTRDGTGYNGLAIRADDKQPTSFVLAARARLREDTVRNWFGRQSLVDETSTSRREYFLHSVGIPASDRVLEGRMEQIPNEGGMQKVVWLRDKKTGQEQKLLTTSGTPALVWCGDLDGDGITDFMLQHHAEITETDELFLSRGAPPGQLVRPAIRYTTSGCC